MGKGVHLGFAPFQSLSARVADLSERARLLSVRLLFVTFGIQASRGLQRSCVDACHENILW